MNSEIEILSNITVYMKYAKFNKQLNRRETWDEIVDRNMQMHVNRFPELEAEITHVYNEYVRTKKVLPSMRSMQFAGRPIELNNSRIFNCAYMPVNHWRAFPEAMFLLLSGAGVGFSVQKHHVEELPEIKKPSTKRSMKYVISDNIEGWAQAIEMLMKSYFYGKSSVRFVYDDIRAKGSLLITSGGKAPGPQPLKDCIYNITKILDSKEDGSKLLPIEAHDIMCHIADAVLAGGIRRSALISLFSIDDAEMIAAKSGNWWETHPARGRANNSAVLLRHRIDKETFLNIWNKVEASNSGEPGIYLTNNRDWGTNPSMAA